MTALSISISRAIQKNLSEKYRIVEGGKVWTRPDLNQQPDTVDERFDGMLPITPHAPRKPQTYIIMYQLELERRDLSLD